MNRKDQPARRDPSEAGTKEEQQNSGNQSGAYFEGGPKAMKSQNNKSRTTSVVVLADLRLRQVYWSQPAAITNKNATPSKRTLRFCLFLF